TSRGLVNPEDAGSRRSYCASKQAARRRSLPETSTTLSGGGSSGCGRREPASAARCAGFQPGPEGGEVFGILWPQTDSIDVQGPNMTKRIDPKKTEFEPDRRFRAMCETLGATADGEGRFSVTINGQKFASALEASYSGEWVTSWWTIS